MQPGLALRRLRALLGKLPDVVETQSWGHPNWRRGTRQFASFDSYRGVPSVCFKAAPRVQAMLARKQHYFLAPYAASRGWVCRTLDEPIRWSEVAALILDSYALLAPRRVVSSERQRLTRRAAGGKANSKGRSRS
jgi:predicted DNA-binding protein (MmcQ/YjbR family)